MCGSNPARQKNKHFWQNLGGKKKKKRKDLEVKGFIFGDFVVFKKLNIKNEVTRIALFPV